MIKANFNAYNEYVTDSLYQWDLNRNLVISGLNLEVAPEIHFANANMDRAIVKQSTLEDGVVTVKIPNSLLQTSLTISAYVGVYEGETFKVIEDISIPVKARVRPYDYTIEDSDEEIYSFKALENRIDRLVVGAGDVVSVNGQRPDENGNIEISVDATGNYVAVTAEELQTESDLINGNVVSFTHNGVVDIPCNEMVKFKLRISRGEHTAFRVLIDGVEQPNGSNYFYNGRVETGITIEYNGSDSTSVTFETLEIMKYTGGMLSDEDYKALCLMKEKIGNIGVVFDEIHNYAESLIGGVEE